jgi:hypothetical protein
MQKSIFSEFYGVTQFGVANWSNVGAISTKIKE